MERMPEEPRQKFEKNDLVRLRPDVDPAIAAELQADSNKIYRVFHYEFHDDEGGDVVWIGPVDMPPQNVEDFQPEMVALYPEGKYKGVFPTAARRFQKVHH